MIGGSGVSIRFTWSIVSILGGMISWRFIGSHVLNMVRKSAMSMATVNT